MSVSKMKLQMAIIIIFRFYMYKLPREKNHLNPLVRRGVAYMHLTPSKLRGGWIMSDIAISDSRSMVGRTLAPLYQVRRHNTTNSQIKRIRAKYSIAA